MKKNLRRGWTTGACAAAAAKAACLGLATGVIPNRVTISLPRALVSTFAVHSGYTTSHSATASVIKDAGDDPDVTHGAEIIVTLTPGAIGQGLVFQAGAGVGTITRPGLPLTIGAPAINPSPRIIIADNIDRNCASLPADLSLEIGVADGANLARSTLNARLGIIGGLSILGTTGVVVPYSCAAWIASIYQSVDVARASGLVHIAGTVGQTSEQAVSLLYNLPEIALVTIGDFIGAFLRYLCRHPLPRLTIAGGFAKLAKLAHGTLDLHSSRSQLDLNYLASLALNNGASSLLAAAIVSSNSASQALALTQREGIDLATPIAHQARAVAAAVVGPAVHVDVALFDRSGTLLAVG